MKTKTTSPRHGWMTTAKGILFIVLGGSILLFPGQALMTLALYIGAIVLASGLWFIVLAFLQRKENPAWGWVLAEGVVDLVLGGVLLFHPTLTAAIIPIFVGLWAVAVGLLQWVVAQQAKRAELPRWWLGLVTGGLSIALGIALLFQPLAGALALTLLIGLEVIFYGVTTLLISRPSHQ